jgi:GxxExxY protein
MNINELTEKIIGCAIEVHRKLGPGLLESTYEACLLYELTNAGLEVKTQIGLPLIYKEIKLEVGYRMDFLVENCVIVEIKSVEALMDVHVAQVLTYLKLSNSKIGLLINFNVLRLKEGIKRLIAKNPSKFSV